jgi:hypothetical protein
MAHPLLHERSVANEIYLRSFAPGAFSHHRPFPLLPFPQPSSPLASASFLFPPLPHPSALRNGRRGWALDMDGVPKYIMTDRYHIPRHGTGQARAPPITTTTHHTHTITTQHTHSLMGDDDGPIQLVSYVLRSLRFAAVRRRLSCLSP